MGAAARRSAGPPASARHAAGTSRREVRDSRGHGRETIESIVVAFTLALLFRAFEAEIFVIPTGSMAPTLMGRHKDVTCEACGAAFRVGCSSEVDQTTGALLDTRPPPADCPNCGRVGSLDRGQLAWHDASRDSFSGDRIIVDKVAYDFRDPTRWDVVVFKFPEDAQINYIKRLVGLPGETITIAGGDLWVSRAGGPAEIARKPAAVLVAMLQCVHDSRHVAMDLVRAGWPAAWSDWSAVGNDAGARWTTADAGRSFAVACGRDAAAELRFRHLVPTQAAWKQAADDRPVAAPAGPVLVGDFQPYNGSAARPRVHDLPGIAAVDGIRWVGDLAVELELESRAASGTVRLDLVEAGVTHACTIDLADGAGTLVRDAREGGTEATARTAVRGRGRWRLLFANVDDELSLFVDGNRVACDGPTTWVRSPVDAAANRPVAAGGEPGGADRGDLAPVGITARGADVTVSGLRVLRDVYYIASKDHYVIDGSRPEPPSVSYDLLSGQFFMLGDNSAASSDSRFWNCGHHVDRHLIVGRALAVIWPHGVPTGWSVPVRIFGWELRLPFLPNFARMRYVR